MTHPSKDPMQSWPRKLLILLLAALHLGISTTLFAGGPDWTVTAMSADSQLSVGERGTLELEISNLNPDSGYIPFYDLFLLPTPELPAGGVLNNPLTILEGGQSVNLLGAANEKSKGYVSYRIPPVTPGKYSLVFGLSPELTGGVDPYFHDSNPANNFRSMAVTVGLPDLIFTNAVVTRPLVDDGDRSVTVSIQNIGTGAPRGSYLLRNVVLSTSTKIEGGSITDGLAGIATDSFYFNDSPHAQNPGYVEMPMGSAITETFEIRREHFRGYKGTLYLIFQLTQVQDIRFPFAPDEPRILQRFINGPLVEARTDNDVLIVPIHTVKPRITLSPVSQSKRPGSTVVFRAEATDFNSLQWLFNGKPIPGETNATLTLANLQPGAAGTYAVSAINELGSVTSDPAVLTIQLPPTVTQSPISQIVGPGSEVTLTVAASSGTPLSYQWRRNGQDIPGATGASYVFSATEGGQFTVVVSNAAGSAESAPATVSLFSVETFPGTVLTGPTGGIYRIEFRNALDPVTAWQPAATLTLTNSPAVWIDQTLPPRAHRFYRAVLIP